MKRNFAKIISLLLAILMLTACSEFENIEQTVSKEKETTTQYTEIAYCVFSEMRYNNIVIRKNRKNVSSTVRRRIKGGSLS